MSGDTSFAYVVMLAMGVAALFLMATVAERANAPARNARYSRRRYADNETEKEGGSFGCLAPLVLLVIIVILAIANLG